MEDPKAGLVLITKSLIPNSDLKLLLVETCAGENFREYLFFPGVGVGVAPPV